MTHARPTRPVPGACQVVLVKAWHLTDAHVIRLGRGQGTCQTPYRPMMATRTRPGSVDVRGTWREVLDVYRDRADLEAMFGEWQPACVQPGCHARLRETGWHVPPATAGQDHEHQPAARRGQMNDDLEKLADQVWEDSESSILIRVCIHEFSDPGQVEDLFVILNRNDLIEAQSLPAAGRETAWDTDDNLAADHTADACAAHAGGILLTRGQLREWAGLGRDLTGDELAQLDDCIASSSIPDAIGTIVFEALKLRGADQEDGAGTGARNSG